MAVARIGLSPEISKAGDPGPWAVEIRLGDQGLAAGGALKLIWMDSAHFADSSRMKPVLPEHDVTVTCPAYVAFTIEHQWLTRCQEGQMILCRAAQPAPAGITVTVVFGPAGRWRLGPFVHSYSLWVYEDVTGNGLFRIIPENHTLRCVAGEPNHLTAVLGSADVNRHQSLWINLWDEFGNPASAEATARVTVPSVSSFEVQLDARVTSKEIHLPDIHADSFVCCVEVPALHLGTESNPAPRLPRSALKLYFGEIHCHTTLSDGMGSLDDLYTYARDVQRLDFAASTDHESHIYGYSLLSDVWPLVREAAGRYYEPGRFVTLLGYEWSAPVEDLSSGHHNIYYRGSEGPLFSFCDPATNSLERLLQALHELGQSALVVPHHPVACKNAAGVSDPSLTLGWETQDPELIRLVEIYSKWGCSEVVPGPFRPLSFEADGHSVLDALSKGYRLGFTGGSDDHTAMPGNLHAQSGGNLRYRNSGLVAVWAPELAREAIFDALYERRCYATSGPRIVLDFSVDGHPMGQEFKTHSRSAPRRIAGTVIGTDVVQAVEIVKDGKAQWVLPGNGTRELAFEVDDRSQLRDSIYCYARVLQADGERAWSSPVWVDPPAA